LFIEESSLLRLTLRALDTGDKVFRWHDFKVTLRCRRIYRDHPRIGADPDFVEPRHRRRKEPGLSGAQLPEGLSLTIGIDHCRRRALQPSDNRYSFAERIPALTFVVPREVADHFMEQRQKRWLQRQVVPFVVDCRIGDEPSNVFYGVFIYNMNTLCT